MAELSESCQRTVSSFIISTHFVSSMVDLEQASRPPSLTNHSLDGCRVQELFGFHPTPLRSIPCVVPRVSEYQCIHSLVTCTAIRCYAVRSISNHFYPKISSITSRFTLAFAFFFFFGLAVVGIEVVKVSSFRAAEVAAGIIRMMGASRSRTIKSSI